MVGYIIASFSTNMAGYIAHDWLIITKLNYTYQIFALESRSSIYYAHCHRTQAETIGDQHMKLLSKYIE